MMGCAGGAGLGMWICGVKFVKVSVFGETETKQRDQKTQSQEDFNSISVVNFILP